MCYAQSEGGQRCYGHAQKRYDKAYAAAIGSGGDLQALDKASIELASTRRGEEQFREELRKLADMHPSAGDLDSVGRVIRLGLELRERNAAVRMAARGQATPEKTVAETVVEPSPIQAQMRAAFAASRAYVRNDGPGYKNDNSGTTYPGLVAGKTSLFASVNSDTPHMGDGPESDWVRTDDDAIPPQRVARGLAVAFYKARVVTSTTDPDGDDETYFRFMHMAATGKAPTDASEVETFKVFNAHAAKYLTRAEIKSAVVRHRAIDVLSEQMQSSGEYTDTDCHYEATEAVDKCERLKHRDGDAAPADAEVQEAAVAVAKAIERSVLLKGAAKKRWAEDLVRDLSGHNVTVRRAPLSDMFRSQWNKNGLRADVAA